MKCFSLLSLLIVLSFTIGCSNTHNLARKEAQAALARTGKPAKPEIISMSDLDSLPFPVRKYLIRSNVVGKERIYTFRGRFKGRIKRTEKAGWMPIEIEQYSTMGKDLTRIFYIDGKILGIFPFVGRDKYENGKGEMLIRPLDLFTVVKSTGPNMDKSALVTFLNDMLMFPMAMVDRRVSWEAVSDTSAKATLTDGAISVSGIFFFNRDFDLVDFVTDDRTYDDGKGDVRKARWWTPLDAHKDMNGVRIPTAGKAVWDFGDRRFPYVEMKFEDIGYNVAELYK